ncbi:MAG: translation initiation factor IF-3 [Alphaproteobacteria bacterium]|nr:translation initiation factor IF-3 [Alphaproteobacteria bacterium]
MVSQGAARDVGNGGSFIARLQTGSAPSRDGPRVNEQINAYNVRLIDHRGEQVGVVSRNQALNMALDVGLDLVEISPNADPPVCKLLDYGKFKYEAQKKAAQARKRQKTIDVKEIKLRPAIDDHDYDVKMRAVKRFIEEGDRVKVTLRFRGRELAHQELGLKVLDRVRAELAEQTKVEQEPKMEGRQMVMVLAPR